MSNVKYIRLVTGEDVISEVLEVSKESHITLYNPAKMIYTFDGEKVRMQMMEWVFSNLVKTNRFALQRRDILLFEDASDDIASTYLEQISETTKDNSKLVEDVLSRRSRSTLD
jgi:hypothetical protein